MINPPGRPGAAVNTKTWRKPTFLMEVELGAETPRAKLSNTPLVKTYHLPQLIVPVDWLSFCYVFVGGKS